MDRILSFLGFAVVCEVIAILTRDDTSEEDDEVDAVITVHVDEAFGRIVVNGCFVLEIVLVTCYQLAWVKTFAKSIGLVGGFLLLLQII